MELILAIRNENDAGFGEEISNINGVNKNKQNIFYKTNMPSDIYPKILDVLAVSGYYETSPSKQTSIFDKAYTLSNIERIIMRLLIFILHHTFNKLACKICKIPS